MFKQVSIIQLSLLQMYGVGWFLGPLLVLMDSRVMRKGTLFPAQTAARNAIRIVLDQSIQRVEVMIRCPDLRRTQLSKLFIEVVYN